jgi:hypothetical protein
VHAAQARVEIAPYLADLVEPVIADVRRRFGTAVDLDDLRQEAAVWWYGPGQRYLDSYLTEDEHYVRLRRSIWRWCARYAEQQRAAFRGYSAADQAHYAPAQIAALLPVALDPDGLPDGGGTHEGPKVKGNLAEGGDVLAMLFDVRRAIHALTFEDQTFLVLTEDLATNWDRIGANLGTLPDSARRRHARIVERMARFLNNELED